MSEDLKTPESVLRYLTRRGEGGGWYIHVNNKDVVQLPHWMWHVMDHHLHNKPEGDSNAASDAKEG